MKEEDCILSPVPVEIPTALQPSTAPNRPAHPPPLPQPPITMLSLAVARSPQRAGSRARARVRMQEAAMSPEAEHAAAGAGLLGEGPPGHHRPARLLRPAQLLRGRVGGQDQVLPGRAQARPRRHARRARLPRGRAVPPGAARSTCRRTSPSRRRRSRPSGRPSSSRSRCSRSSRSSRPTRPSAASWSIRSDYENGDLGFDPLGLKPESPPSSRRW